jgi:SAM-dependent methyltransferase
VLEVGCGTGHFTRWLAEEAFRVAGLDISEAMLAEARKRNGVLYVVGDALALPLFLTGPLTSWPSSPPWSSWPIQNVLLARPCAWEDTDLC